ncbi:Glycoside hydrolase family 5 protein [Mycena venus]|uniref:Glycoside hydrolase family 5 protein n=1 Tax=Mycena venus TaxID=2733690 RepID=A0A8H7CTK7_9AGAR|nr:Glycoside hydrolase family 5 protein [Mycena venus]
MRVILGLSFISSALALGFPYGSQKVRGVNLGGWLVLEPWITPSLFDNTGNANIVDEWTFASLQSRATATAALSVHWNTFITESDFADIAAAGLNHVRLPIGYWAWDVSGGEPYIQGQLPFLNKAVAWAGNHGLKLIIDLHGAPGSQNGFDNSGHRGDATWALAGSSGRNVQRTNAVIKQIANLYKDNSSVVPIIAPLNEPAGFNGGNWLSVIRQYWLDSYGNIRYPYGSSRQSDTLMLIHDAFQSLSYWNGFLTYPQYNGEEQMSMSDHIRTVCAKQSQLANFDLWVIVGEWTPAHTDCAKYLLGRGVGSRYDGSYAGSTRVGSCTGLTGKASSFSSSYKTFLRQFWEAQVISYEKGQGWIQWTWKAENADEWSYQAGLANGWIPMDPTNHIYPNICG